MQRTTPPHLEIASSVLRLPIVANNLVAVQCRIVAKGSQHFQSAFAVMQRLDHRLHDRDRAFVGARITPGFKVVRFRNMPVDMIASLVVSERKLDVGLHFIHRLHKIEIGGRIVNRIAADNHQHVNFSGVHVSNQIADGLSVLDRINFNGINVRNGLAGIA